MSVVTTIRRRTKMAVAAFLVVLATALAPAAPAFATSWPSCSGQDHQYILDSYYRAAGGGMSSGVTNLRCGFNPDPNWGFRHIQVEHSSQWQYYANFTGMNWTDYADWVFENVLAAPSTVTYRSANDTYAYRAPIQVWNGSTLVAQYTGVVVVSHGSGNIITAYPET